MAEDNMPQETPQQPSGSGSSSNTPLIAGVIIVIIAAIAYFALRGSNTDTMTNDTSSGTTTPPQTQQTPQPTPPPVPGGSTDTSVPVKSFTVTAQPFSFSPAEIRVKKGDLVKINFVIASGTHDFVIDEFNVKTAVLEANKSQQIEFVASAIGTFEYYCSVGNHRAMGMKGKFIVE